MVDVWDAGVQAKGIISPQDVLLDIFVRDGKQVTNIAAEWQFTIPLYG